MKNLDTISDALGVSLSTVRGTFAAMEVAEERIDHFKRRHPKKREELHRSFLTLMPTGEMTKLDKRVYRSHCDELLRRIVDGADVTLGTDAECLMAAMSAVTKAPPDRRLAAAIDQLFRSVMGDSAWSKLGLRDKTTEPWSGSTVELLDGLRKQLRRADRGVSKRKGA